MRPQKMPPRKRTSPSKLKKEPVTTPLASTATTNANNDNNSAETASPPPMKKMNLDSDPPVPVVAKEKQPPPEPVNPVNKEPMNVLMQMQDLAKNMETNCNQFKNELERLEKHGTHNFVITNDFIEKMKEISEKTSALNALIPESANIHPLRKRIQLTLKNCRELFAKDDFIVKSTSIELLGFKWYLQANVMKKGFLGLYLYAIPPNGYNGNYRIEVDCRFSILSAFTGNDLIREYFGQVYIMLENCHTGYGKGYPDVAKFDDLLDPSKTFLTPEGNMEICADFTTKSSTLNHLT